MFWKGFFKSYLMFTVVEIDNLRSFIQVKRLYNPLIMMFPNKNEKTFTAQIDWHGNRAHMSINKYEHWFNS